MSTEPNSSEKSRLLVIMVHSDPHDSSLQDPALDENNGVTAQLSTWVTGLQLKDVPTDVLERAKHLILDGIVCGLVGARVPWSEECVASVLDFEPPGYCTVIGYEKVSLLAFLSHPSA